MGILGGLQMERARSHWENFEDPTMNKNLIFTLVPWSGEILKLASKKDGDETVIVPAKLDKEKAKKSIQ